MLLQRYPHANLAISTHSPNHKAWYPSEVQPISCRTLRGDIHSPSSHLCYDNSHQQSCHHWHGRAPKVSLFCDISPESCILALMHSHTRRWTYTYCTHMHKCTKYKIQCTNMLQFIHRHIIRPFSLLSSSPFRRILAPFKGPGIHQYLRHDQKRNSRMQLPPV